MKTTAETITRILCEQLGLSDDHVQPEKRLAADLGADSLDSIEIQMAIEAEFDLAIPDDEFAKCSTVADVVTLVERLLPTQVCADNAVMTGPQAPSL